MSVFLKYKYTAIFEKPRRSFNITYCCFEGFSMAIKDSSGGKKSDAQRWLAKMVGKSDASPPHKYNVNADK